MPEQHDTPWTPGPWRVHAGPVTGTLHIVTGSVGHIVCNIHGAAAKCYEDARLIAAAPSLAEAAQMLEDAEYAWANCPECEGRIIPELCPVCFPKFDEARLKRRAALALARGETNG